MSGQHGVVGSGERTASLELDPVITAPSQARSYVRDLLEDWYVPLEAIQTAETLVSEMVTNACRAAAELPGPDERIGLTLWLLPTEQVVIEVSDHDPAPPVLKEADLDSESGRGLILVQALSKEWGYLPLALGGKVVYAIIDAPAPPQMPWHLRIHAHLYVAYLITKRLTKKGITRLR